MILKSESSHEWTNCVLTNFDEFLLDHAACERKASAMAMSLVAHYRDKPELVSEMIDLAIEELEHFRQVYALIRKRGLDIPPDAKDEYVQALRKLIRNGKSDFFMDRLLIAGVIEGRGTERFLKVAEALEDSEFKQFYLDFARAEARHHGLFIRLAKKYFDPVAVDERLEVLLSAEAEIVSKLPIRPAVH